MPDLHVIFPKSGAPLVTHDRLAVFRNQVITWHIKSENPAIDKVKIDFTTDTKTPPFFDGSPSYTKYLEKSQVKLKDKDGNLGAAKEIGNCVIWGEAPNFGDGSDDPDRTTDKYTVVGLTAKGGKIAELDPEIMTEKP